MLKNIDSLLSPELVMHLRAMGHGDELAIVDANFPAASCAQKLVRLDGLSATTVLNSVLSILPLDQYVTHSSHTMQVVNDTLSIPDIVSEFTRIIAKQDTQKNLNGTLERFEFYQRVKQAFVVIATGENRLYGNILLKKGIINRLTG